MHSAISRALQRVPRGGFSSSVRRDLDLGRDAASRAVGPGPVFESRETLVVIPVQPALHGRQRDAGPAGQGLTRQSVGRTEDDSGVLHAPLRGRAGSSPTIELLAGPGRIRTLRKVGMHGRCRLLQDLTIARVRRYTRINAMSLDDRAALLRSLDSAAAVSSRQRVIDSFSNLAVPSYEGGRHRARRRAGFVANGLDSVCAPGFTPYETILGVHSQLGEAGIE